jgi:hypothetical protein
MPASDWPDIDPNLIEDGRGTVPLLPLDLLPLPWRAWVGERARAAGAPVDYVVQAVLAAVAGVCGAGAVARVTPDWDEPLVLWQVLVGASSSGKSPALAPVRRLLGALDPELPVSEGDKKPRIVADEPALAAVAEAVAANPRGVLLWRDEPSAWLAELGSKDEGHRARWLDAWSGQAFAVEAALSRTVPLEKFPLSVLGAIRPDRLEESLRQADSGLAARFLYAWPDPPTYCPLAERRTARDEQALDLLRRMLKVARTPLNPLVLAFDKDALKAFDGFLSMLHLELGRVDGLEADWMGKGSGTVARLAGILELLAWSGSDTGAAPQQIGAPSVQAAVRLWGDYFRPHAVRVFGRAAPCDTRRHARSALRWLEANRKCEVTREDIRRHALRRAIDASRTNTVLGELWSAGVLRPAPLPDYPQVGRPAERWQVNPVLWAKPE